MGLFGNLAAFIVPYVRVESGYEHQRRLYVLVNDRTIGFDPSTALDVE